MRSSSCYSRLRRRVAQFRSDQRGNFTTIAAATILPLLLTIGAAVDYSEASMVRSQLQNAVDAATLAATRAATEGTTNENKLSKIADKSLEANFPDAKDLKSSLSYNPDSNVVRVTATASSRTAFMKLVHIETIEVSADAEAVASGIEAEVSMVLDVTGSMYGSKIISLRTAATSLVDILLPSGRKNDMIRVAMVPYAASVNIGTLAKSHAIKEGKTSWAPFYAKVKKALEREGDTYWEKKKIQDYIEDMGEGRAYTDGYKCVTERIGGQAKTDVGNLMSSPLLDMTRNCPAAQVIPLTNDGSNLKSEISKLTASGVTAGHVGLGVGWYTLSRNMGKRIWPYNEKPKKYKDILKVLVLMTDGAFNTKYVGDSSSKQALELCENAKKKDVVIYSVGFQAPRSALTMLQQCATSSAHFFDARSGLELEKVFKQIASETKALRLSM